MSFIVPEYYHSFKCIAEACPDSCCRAGWAIPIDSETLDFYRSADIGIENNTVVDDDGDCVFKLREDKSCVYFRHDGLCDIYIKTGGRLCDICTKYPRYFEEYEGFTEAGIALSCPAAAEAILSLESNPYIDLDRRSSDRLVEFLASARKMAIEMIYNEKDPDTAAEQLLGFGLDLQDLIDFDELERLSELDFMAEELMSDEGLAVMRRVLLNETEILTEAWRDLLTRPAIKKNGTETQRRSYLAYLTYRYFLKAINTEDIFALCGFIAAMYRLTCSLDADFSESAKLCCREIEHDTDNIEVIIENICGQAH